MSRPIRYGLSDEDLGRIHSKEDGHLVMWSDYAALQAQLERLRAAGDQMLGTMLWAAHKNPDGPAEKRILAWINARDGNEEAAK